jgi:four helix bundle protein
MTARKYQELIAWQVADMLRRFIFRMVLASSEAGRDLRLRTQLLEAARSVPANIAEGFRRKSPGDFARFLDYSLASLAEAEERLGDGLLLGYFTERDHAAAFVLAKRTLTATIRLKQSQVRYAAELRKERTKLTKPRKKPDPDSE